MTSECPNYIAKAFGKEAFTGNPAAVVVLTPNRVLRKVWLSALRTQASVCIGTPGYDK